MVLGLAAVVVDREEMDGLTIKAKQINLPMFQVEAERHQTTTEVTKKETQKQVSMA